MWQGLSTCCVPDARSPRPSALDGVHSHARPSVLHITTNY